MFMSREHLVTASNRTRPSAIIRWLDKLKLKYKVDADGWPVVEWADWHGEKPQPQDNEPRRRRCRGRCAD